MHIINAAVTQPLVSTTSFSCFVPAK